MFHRKHGTSADRLGELRGGKAIVVTGSNNHSPVVIVGLPKRPEVDLGGTTLP